MKKTLSALVLITSLMSQTILAEEIVIPRLESPSALQEGTQRDLTPAQIAELLPWAKDSKIFLTDLLDNAQNLPMEQRIDRLVDGIKQVVVDSAPKQSELIMRYALNRALVLNNILIAETTEGEVGTSDAKARVLTASIKLALKYYDSDMASLSKKTALPYAAFGVEYYSFLYELNKSVFDASAQYNIQRTALEFLQWDLYRDLNNTTYAPQIVKINNALKIFPTKKMSDAYSINLIRQMKKTSEQLNIIVKGPREEEEKKQQENVNVSRGKYVSIYSSYYETNVCYNADRDGNKIGTSTVDNKFCQVGHDSFYSSYYETNLCFPVDSNGKKLGSTQVDNSLCRKSYKSFYSSYYETNLCFPADKNGKKLGSSQVDIKFCQ